MAKADGGEILVSEMVRQLAGTVPGVQYRDRGRHDFKGFDEPWRLYEVVWPGAPPKRAKTARAARRGTASRSLSRGPRAGRGSGRRVRGDAWLGRRDRRRPPEQRRRDRPADEPDRRSRCLSGSGPGRSPSTGRRVDVGRQPRRPQPDEDRRTNSEREQDDRPRRPHADGDRLRRGRRLGCPRRSRQLSRVDLQFNRAVAAVDATAAPPTAQSAGVALVRAPCGPLRRLDARARRSRNLRVLAGFIRGRRAGGVVVAERLGLGRELRRSNVDRFNPGTFQQGPLGSGQRWQPARRDRVRRRRDLGRV